MEGPGHGADADRHVEGLADDAHAAAALARRVLRQVDVRLRRL